MKSRFRSIAVPTLLFFALGSALAFAIPLEDAAVYLSHRGGCTDEIVSVLAHTRTEVLVQAYSFTSAPIAKTLVDAYKRGVRVEIVLDKSQRSQRYSSADFAAHAGIPAYIDAEHAIAHNKIMIIDRDTVRGHLRITHCPTISISSGSNQPCLIMASRA